MTQYVRNILKVYRQATAQEVTNGKLWYADALERCEVMASKYGCELHIVVGVVAALSPSNKWERNLIDADHMLDVFTSGGYLDDVVVSTYGKMKEKAWAVLQAGLVGEADVAGILNGPKITDFYWCILGRDTCVIDGHAWGIANRDRRTMQDVPSIGKAMRKELQDAYGRAAKRAGVTAFEMQAITWVAWKRIHNV